MRYTFGIQPVDLEVWRLLKLSFDLVTHCQESFVLLIVVWCLYSPHTFWELLSLLSWWECGGFASFINHLDNRCNMSDFGATAGIMSDPSAIPHLVWLIIMSFYSVVVGVTAIERSVCSGSISGVFIGTGLFKCSSKCSSYLLCCRWIWPSILTLKKAW